MLSSLVLPGLPVDHLVLWQELVTGLFCLETSTKFQKLEAALYPHGSRWPINAMRLSAAGIAVDAPDVFETANSAREWRRNLPTETIFEMIRMISDRHGGRPRFVWLRRSTGGTPTPAVLFSQCQDLAGAVSRHWPRLELITSVDDPDRSALAVQPGRS